VQREPALQESRMTATPTLVWAQRVNKVFVTFEMIGTSNVNVSFTDGLLSLDAEAGGKKYKLENMPLWAEIDSESSKWFSNDRAVVITLKKKEEEWWDGLTKDKALKRFIKVSPFPWPPPILTHTTLILRTLPF